MQCPFQYVIVVSLASLIPQLPTVVGFIFLHVDLVAAVCPCLHLPGYSLSLAALLFTEVLPTPRISWSYTFYPRIRLLILIDFAKERKTAETSPKERKTSPDRARHHRIGAPRCRRRQRRPYPTSPAFTPADLTSPCMTKTRTTSTYMTFPSPVDGTPSLPSLVASCSSMADAKEARCLATSWWSMSRRPDLDQGGQIGQNPLSMYGGPTMWSKYYGRWNSFDVFWFCICLCTNLRAHLDGADFECICSHVQIIHSRNIHYHFISLQLALNVKKKKLALKLKN